MNNESFRLFIRLINEKHSKCKSCADSVIIAFVSEDLDAKKKAAHNMLVSLNELKSCISSEDAPEWLNYMIQRLGQYNTGVIDSYNFITFFFPLQQSMKSHSWSFSDNESDPFNFDSIFEKYKKQSQIPNLFNQIISILEQIKDSGDIDSLTMINSLNKVISTINVCKESSYFSLNSAWNFLLNFIKNYLWGELSKIPVLGAALDALAKTIIELDGEMNNLNNNIKEEMVRVVEGEMKFLEKKSSFPFLSYTPSGNLLSQGIGGELADISV
ncbi:hypothetical protein [Trichlorobacter lovleyi]|uniref:hypothetical protein n=1 Tax=Trichlorobacter lovleyi TaxID=313985 RepID=UPI003D0CF660